MRRIALYGRSGAGKSTFSQMLTDELATAGIPSLTIKIAAPLYELQAIVYTVAGRPLLSGGRQDGLLLSDLGSHLRRIAPDALINQFALRVHQAETDTAGIVLICDDLRAPDAAAVTALDFTLVEVSAPDTVRRARRGGRQDLALGDENHATEAPVIGEPGYRISNAGRLGDLRVAAAQLVAQLRVEVAQ